MSSTARTPARRPDPILAAFDNIGMAERERARAKAEYVQIEAMIDRIWNLGAALAKSVHGSRARH